VNAGFRAGAFRFEKEYQDPQSIAGFARLGFA
jgi:hypothetical protein